MPQANEAVWLPVLPSFRDFGPALITGAGSEADAAGSQIGQRFGKAMATGVVAAGAGVTAAGVFLYKVGEVFDDVADTIRVGTGASGAALDGLVESAKRVGQTVPAEFEQVGSTVADINTRMGLSGDTLETVAAQYLEAGRILGEDVDINKTSAAFNAFGIEGEAVVGAMDHLFQVSQATGVGMNDLATVVGVNAPAMKALGFSFQETAVMAGSLDKAGLNSNKMMAAMSKGMVTLAKDGEAPQQAFQRVVGEIQGFIASGDQAAALELASKVFGTKGAPQFIEALQSGALNLDDLTRAAGQSADSILGVGAETMDFAEAWQLFKNNVLVWLEPLGATVFGALGTWMGLAVAAVAAFTDAWGRADGTITQGGLLGFMEALAARALEVYGWFQNSLVPALAAFGGWVQQNAAALGFFAAVLGAAGAALGLYVGTIQLVTAAKTAWAAITTALQAKQVALNAAMAANPIGVVLVALTALVAGLVFAYTHFESFRQIVDGAWAGIVAAAQSAWNGFLLPIFTAISTWITGVLAPMFTSLWTQYVAPAWVGIVAAVQSAWAVIGPALASLGSSLSSLGALILSALVPAFTFLAPIVGRVAQVLGVVLGGAITVAVGFITMLVSAFVDHLAGAIRGAITFIQGLISFVSAVFRGDWASAWNAAKDMAVGAFQFLWHAINVVLTVNVLGAVRSGLAAMLGLFRGGMSSITGVFAATWNGIVALVRGAWNGILGVARGGASGLSSLVNGLVNGILGFFRNLAAGMGSIISNAWSVARSTFGGATAALRTMVSQMVSGVLGFFRNMGTGIATHARAAMDTAKRLVSGGMTSLRTSVSEGISKVLTFFRDMPGKILSALGNLGSKLTESGRALLGGFMDGIGDGFNRAKDVVAGGMESLRRLFPFSPAKEGPFSGRGYTTYSGRALSRDFADAIAGEADYLADRADRFMAAADFSATPMVSPSTLAAASSSLGWGSVATAAPVDPGAVAALTGLPDTVTLVLDDGTKLRTHIEGITTAQAASWVAGLQQPLRQTVGSR